METHQSVHHDWEAQMQAALAANQEQEGELLESITDDEFTDTEWQWQLS